MSSAFEAGFLLAAVLGGDASAEQALAGLAPALAEPLAERARAFRDALERDRARALVRLTAEAKARTIEAGQEPRRVLALIATEVPRERGAVWLAAVSKNRGGWSGPAALKDLLARTLSTSTSERAAREIRELGPTDSHEAAWRG